MQNQNYLILGIPVNYSFIRTIRKPQGILFNPLLISKIFMPKPLYFLTHEGNPGIFSGYGIPLSEGKSPLVGMLMIDRPERCPPEYLDSLHETFGDIEVAPMTSKGDRGIYTQMRIEDPLSLSLLRDDIYNSVADAIADILDRSVRMGFMAKPRLKVRWSSEHQAWVSEFDFGGDGK